MAKKKKRKKKTPDAAPSEKARDQSARAARKAAARRERERQMRAYRRGRFLRRAAIGTLAVGAVAAIVVIVILNTRESGQRREEALAIAAQIGCQEVEEQPDEGRAHSDQPEPFSNVPATSGPHSASPLPSDVSVYEDPFDLSLEWRAVHNLEHGWVIMYYQPDGDDALGGEILSALTDLAEREEEVMLAPYPSLPQGESLVLTAWNRAQRCLVDGTADETVTVVEAFIDQFRNAGEAPEPAA